MDPQPLEQPLAEELRQLTNPKQWLMALHLTCTYLAAKNVDKVGHGPSLCVAILLPDPRHANSICTSLEQQRLQNRPAPSPALCGTSLKWQ